MSTFGIGETVEGKFTIHSKLGLSYFVELYLLFALVFAGYKADLKAHSKHLSSFYFTLSIAFLLTIGLGKGMYDEPFNGLCCVRIELNCSPVLSWFVKKIHTYIFIFHLLIK